MINKLEIKDIPLYDYWKLKKGIHKLYGNYPLPVIDGISIGDIINEHIKDTDGQLSDYDYNLLTLTYEKNLDFTYCNRFMDWILSLRSSTVVPILVCDADQDFTCEVIVAHMRFDDNYAYLDEISLVNNSLLGDDRCYGIADFGAYSDEDWEKYGTTIAFEKVGSPKWNEWVSENFQEEMFRRLKNYYYPFIQNKNNLISICKPHYIFDRTEYEEMLKFYDNRKIT